MVSIERTAYPRFSKPPVGKELQRNFTPTEEERAWAERTARNPIQRLGLLVLLKIFQYLHYFPSLEDVPPEVINHVRESLGYAKRIVIDYSTERTLYRHMAAVRSYLRVKAFYGTDASEIADKLARESAELLDQRIDIINALVDELVHRQMELPAFSALDTLAERAHAEVQERIFNRVLSRIPPKTLEGFKALLLTDKLEHRQSEYNTLKKSAKRPLASTLKCWSSTWSGLNQFPESIRFSTGLWIRKSAILRRKPWPTTYQNCANAPRPNATASWPP